MSNEHMWGNPDFAGACACVKKGCPIRVADGVSWWQRKRGGHWRRVTREPIPECTGEPALLEAKP